MNSSCSVCTDGEVLGGQMHGPNIIGSHGESHKEMVSSGSLLTNDTKGFGSPMVNKSWKSNQVNKITQSIIKLAHEGLSKLGG